MLLHDTHGHGEQNVTGCSGVLQTLADDASHGGQLAGGISVSYTDKGANGQPALTTVTQTVIQLKRHEAELADRALRHDRRQHGIGPGVLLRRRP